MRWISKSTSQEPKTFAVSSSMSSLWNCAASSACWAEDGIWVLRTTRQWLPRDLDVLRPLLERMRIEGPDFLQKNAALADEVRRTLVDLDELKKAAKAIDTAAGLTGKYRVRLQSLCEHPHPRKILCQPQEKKSGIPQIAVG